jgi:uncharacterized membrane protein YsdA (DUF1294 family)
VNGVLIYLIIVNVLSGILFYYDKYLANNKKSRISENLLHAFELFGGAFINLILIYTIRHKNQKPKYYWYTIIFALLWVYLYYANL